MNTKRGRILLTRLAAPFATVILLAGAPIAQAAYPDIILGDKPAAYYRLEEAPGATVAVDSTTNHLNATYVYNTDDTYPALGLPGIDTNSVGFDGGGSIGNPSDYISIPYSPFLAPTNADGVTGAPFSAELWVEANGQPGNYSIPLCMFGAYAGSGTYANASGWNFYQSPGPNSYWIFNMKPSPFLSYAGVPVVPFQWYHLVGTYDGTTASFYINGVLVTAAPASSQFFADNGYPGQIGAGANVGFTPFNGGVDEVAIYGYALSPTQVAAHYAAGTNSFRAVSLPPGFAARPASTTNYAGTVATFSTIANGTGPLTYQWNRGVTPIGGATNSSYSFITAYPADNQATFSVTVTGALGSTNSGLATLTVLTNLSLVANPFSITRNTGSKAAFRAVATGALPLSYQWFITSNSVSTAVSGATNDTLWLNKLTNSLSGNQYFCQISNPFVVVSSSSASLTVQTRPINIPLTSHYAKMIVADDPVGYWRLDETANEYPLGDSDEDAVDAIGSFDGDDESFDLASSFSYDVTPPGIPNETDGALGLNNLNAPGSGGGSVVTIPYALELNPVSGPWSAEAWVKPAALDPNNYHTVISSMYNVGGSYNNLYGWLIYQTPDGHFIFNMFNGSAGGSFNPGTAVTAGTWYHLVITDDLTNQYFYVNGVLVSELSQSFGFTANGTNGDPSVAGSPTVFGQRSDFGFGAFNGTVDDVAFYNYTLTATQISNHYNNVTAAPTITIGKVGSSVTLTWSTGSLVSSTNVSGPYTPVAGAASPYPVTTTVGPKVFYRAVTGP